MMSFFSKFYLVFAGLALILGSQISFAAAPNLDKYPFQSPILLNGIESETRVQVDFNAEILSEISPKMNNLALFDGQNNSVNFSVFFEEVARIKSARATEVSSQKLGELPDLTDSDPLTPFHFDKKIDRNQAAWFLVDLGEMREVARAKIFPSFDAIIRTVQIDAGPTPQKLKTLVSRRDFDRTFDFQSAPVRFLKIYLTGPKIKLIDSKFYGSERGSIYFDAEPGQKYRLLFGADPNFVAFEKKLAEKITEKIQGNFLKKQANPAAPADFDGDGFDFLRDNCPLDSNPSQKDRDADGVGDDCDNAPQTKNANQSDVDRDSVGDIIDNCKLIPNPNQADRDADGRGNACDNAHAISSDEIAAARIKWAVLVAAALVLSSGAMMFWRAGKRKKSEKIK